MQMLILNHKELQNKPEEVNLASITNITFIYISFFNMSFLLRCISYPLV